MKRLCAIFLSLALICGFTSCKKEEAVDSADVMNIGVQSNILSLPTVYAAENGYFRELGLNVKLTTFSSGSSEFEGLHTKDIDIASDGLASIYTLADSDCEWIGESDCGSSTMRIYVSPDSKVLEHKGEIEGKPKMYGSADSLRNLKVLGPEHTMEHWAAEKYFSQFGLVEGKDYQFINEDRSQAAEDVLNGKGDMFVATDVDYSNAMEAAGFVVVADCTDATDSSFNNGYVVRKEYLNDNYDKVIRFLKAVYKAADALQNTNTRNEFAYKFNTDNNKPASMDDVKYETNVRPFFTTKDVVANPPLGSSLLEVGKFLCTTGAITEAELKTAGEAINPQPFNDAFGLSVNAATTE